MPNSYCPFDQIQLGLNDLSEELMKTATLFLLSILAAPAVGQTVYKCSDFDGKPIYQQTEECPNGKDAEAKIDMGVFAKKVTPLYTRYHTIKSIIESIRKEPQLTQLSAMDIQNAIQKYLDIANISLINAMDLKMFMSPNGRVLDLIYDDEREIFDGSGLFVVLRVREQIPLTPRK